MTPAMLERATEPFRFGYWDRRDGNAPWTRGGEASPGTFVHHDYVEGWNAANAENRRWDGKDIRL